MRRNNLGTGMGHRGGGGGGPLMTGHLQDLELELELLKRKRQLIQQQQNEALHHPSAGQMAYHPPRQMYDDRYDAPPRRDFPHLYEEAPRGARPPAPKRRPVPVWDSAPGDQLGGPPGPYKRPRPGPLPPPARFMPAPPPQPPRPAPMPSLLGPIPLMSFNHIPQKSQYPRPRPFHPNFKQNVRPPGQINPNSSPKKATTNKPTRKPPSVPVASKEKESSILTADVKPSSKVNGRLEMALGILSKELKEAHTSEEHLALFGTPPLARLVRQGIRERLRAVMLGKEVDAVPNVLAEYRKAFPPSMDADLLKLTEVEEVDQDQKLAIELLEKDDPELYFKKNMTKLLEVKLDEIFQKAEKSYEDENVPSPSEVVGNLPEVKTAPTEDALKAGLEETSDGEGADESHPRAQEYDKQVSWLLEHKLPALLATHKKKIIKLLDLDQMFGTTKAAVVMNTCTKNYQFRKTQHNISHSEFLATLKSKPAVLPRSCPYFAKVHANPAMPKHTLMQAFLRKFSPKTIKRCKEVFNLLYVGFSNKDDYDRILKADQTQIGTSTLTIVGNDAKAVHIDIKDEKSDALDQAKQMNDQIKDLEKIEKKEAKEGDGTNGEIKKEDKKVINEMNESFEETNGNDSDVQEVTVEAEIVAIDDDASAE